MSSRLFALGDLHGHYDELIALYGRLLEAGFEPERDTLVQLGDLVDGGPDTKRVVDWCIARSRDYPHWVFLLGNHEDLLLDALRWNERVYGNYHLWWSQGGRETASSYLPADVDPYDRALMAPKDFIPAEHLDWLESRPLRHEQGGYHFVHAGFRPAVPLAEQSREDLLWIRESFFERRYNFGQPVVFGHTVFKQPLVVTDEREDHRDEIVAIGIDGMRHNTGKLIAVELPRPGTGELRFFLQPALRADDPIDRAA